MSSIGTDGTIPVSDEQLPPQQSFESTLKSVIGTATRLGLSSTSIKSICQETINEFDRRDRIDNVLADIESTMRGMTSGIEEARTYYDGMPGSEEAAEMPDDWGLIEFLEGLIADCEDIQRAARKLRFLDDLDDLDERARLLADKEDVCNPGGDGASG